jgi:glycosyltransferase involved in cell wall biosynthesis
MPASRTTNVRRGIIHVIHHREYSGAERAHLPLMLADPRPLLACPPGSSTESFTRQLGIETVPLPYRPMRSSAGRRETLRSIGRGVSSAWALRSLLKRLPDRSIVVGSGPRDSMLAALATTGFRGRRNVWVLTQLVRPGPLTTAIRLLARLRADRVIAHSQAVFDGFVGRSRALRARSTVVHPGIDVGAFTIPATRPQASRVAIVGYISEVKRTDLAVEVARRVATRLPDFELLVVGSAQYRPEDFELERRLTDQVAADPLLRDHVRFCGYVSDVPRLLRGVRVLLHTCEVEGFGLAIVEAMAAGLPVVAPRVGGPSEIVDDQVTGLLYEPGDVGEAARHVERLLRAPEEAEAMGRAGRARAERLFAAETYVAGFSSVIDTLPV